MANEVSHDVDDERTNRGPVRENHAVLDVDVHVTVGDLETVDDLADVDMGNTSVGVSVRVLADSIRHGLCELWSEDVLDEAVCDVKGVGGGMHGEEAISLDVIGTCMEDGVGMFRAKAEGLASGGWVVSVAQSIASKASDKEGRDEDPAHKGIGSCRI